MGYFGALVKSHFDGLVSALGGPVWYVERSSLMELCVEINSGVGDQMCSEYIGQCGWLGQVRSVNTCYSIMTCKKQLRDNL